MSKRSANSSLIEELNRALSLEYAATVQYLQQSFLVTGKERKVFEGFFSGQSSEAHQHASDLGNRIVALGGIPTVEPALIRQATKLDEMLHQDLEMEREAIAAYLKAWEAAETNLPVRFWLEGIIQTEQVHIEELEKLTSEREVRAGSVDPEVRLKAAS